MLHPTAQGFFDTIKPDGDAVRLQKRGIAYSFHCLKGDHQIGCAFPYDRRVDFISPMHLRGDCAAALAHAMDFRRLYIISGTHQAGYKNLGSENGALSANTHENRTFAAHA